MGWYERTSHAVPLVSGVCREASAPTLPHGGLRLNASKPEANPKTRYASESRCRFSINSDNTTDHDPWSTTSPTVELAKGT